MLNKHLRTTYKNKSNNLLIFSMGKKVNAFFLISWNKLMKMLQHYWMSRIYCVSLHHKIAFVHV